MGAKEREELARLCCSKDWSKAIRILDSLLAQSCTIQDICNRAFCYSQLELHKHVIKDCDKALQLDPASLQPYILKGHALLAVGRKEEAFSSWQQGYGHALKQSSDIKHLLELEELLSDDKESVSAISGDQAIDTSTASSQKTDTSIASSQKKDTSTASSQKKDTSTASSQRKDTSTASSQKKDTSTASSQKKDTSSSKKKDASPAVSEKKDTSALSSKKKGTSTTSSQKKDTSTTSSQKKGTSTANTSDSCAELACKSNGMHEIDGKPREVIETWNESKSPNVAVNNSEVCVNQKELSDTSSFNMKLRTKGSSKTKSISLDFRLSRGIAQVNDGNYKHAISLFNQILRENPTSPEALIGRGTAYAFQRELEAAIADFTMAIKSNPVTGEAWKRRGQARAALGELSEAIEDLTKSLDFEPNSSDILHERGIVNYKFKDYNAAMKDLSSCTLRDKYNKSAFTYLGLALANLGEYNKAEEAHLKSIKLDKNFLDGWAHLIQFYKDMADYEKALKAVYDVLASDQRFAKAYYLRGMLYHGTGQHRKAVKDFSVALSIEYPNIEYLYYRASSYHAIGEFRDAIKDYDAVLEVELDSMEKFVLQCLAFYQKEIALYTAAKANSEFWVFDIDGDINPLFKEYWCKKLHPKDVCERVFRQTPLKESLKKGRLRQQDFMVTKQKSILLQASDTIGKKIQYNCPGFLSNRRQHRMAGLAVIEIAQKVSKSWRILQAEWRNSTRASNKNNKKARRRDRISLSSQNRGGAGCSTSSPSDGSTSYLFSDDGSSCRNHMPWQDVYSIAVRWRQISEPCDHVVWINKLSEEFNSGFGSNTPMLLGQSKMVRYYPNFDRALNIVKTILEDSMFANNSDDKCIDLSKSSKLQNLKSAQSCSDLYDIVGENFWVGTTCGSTAVEGKQLEGTRISTQKVDERGFEFTIKTPCTPFRWNEYDAEMTNAWEILCNSCCYEKYGSTDVEALENVKDAILRIAYYWYNFMPLARGSAVVGYVVLLGMFLAANMEVTADVPPGVQVDWEAVLSPHPDAFIESIKKWLYPSLRVTTTWKDYPDVSSTFATTGSVIAALSKYSD